MLCFAREQDEPPGERASVGRWLTRSPKTLARRPTQSTNQGLVIQQEYTPLSPYSYSSSWIPTQILHPFTPPAQASPPSQLSSSTTLPWPRTNSPHALTTTPKVPTQAPHKAPVDDITKPYCLPTKEYNSATQTRIHEEVF